MRTLELPIRTARLNLREFVRGDFDAVHAYSADPRVTRYLFFGPRDQDHNRTKCSVHRLRRSQCESYASETPSDPV